MLLAYELAIVSQPQMPVSKQPSRNMMSQLTFVMPTSLSSIRETLSRQVFCPKQEAMEVLAIDLRHVGSHPAASGERRLSVAVFIVAPA